MNCRVYFIAGTVALLVLICAGFSKLTDEKTLESPLESVVTDVDGNRYRTIRIGRQIWMAENLKVTHYRDGSPIPCIQSDGAWSQQPEGAFCTAGDDVAAYKDMYGLLYNHFAVENIRGLAPEGWHVPVEAECRELIEYLGGFRQAGKALRDSSWQADDWRPSQNSGFNGLPAGGRGRLGSPGDVGNYATWWSSTISEPDYAWHWGLHPDKSDIRANPGHRASGFSVRCIKNSEEQQ